jgi:hypothetical protein
MLENSGQTTLKFYNLDRGMLNYQIPRTCQHKENANATNRHWAASARIQYLLHIERQTYMYNTRGFNIIKKLSQIYHKRVVKVILSIISLF